MWNVISSNRILDIQMRKESYRRHKNSIKNAKPQIVINSPAQYSFLVYKPKTKQLALQHQTQIQAENSDLVRRMIETKSKSRPHSRQSSAKNSLNSSYKHKVSEQIDKQNRKLIDRLRGASSSFSFSKFEKQHQVYLQRKANITKNRPMSGISCRSNSNNIRPFSAR